MEEENKVFWWFKMSEGEGNTPESIDQSLPDAIDTSTASEVAPTGIVVEEKQDDVVSEDTDAVESKTADDVEKEISEEVDKEVESDNEEKIKEAKEEIDDTMENYINIIKENPKQIASLMQKIHEKQSDYVEQLIQKETNEKVLKTKLQKSYERIADLENKEESISIPEDHQHLYRSLSLLAKDKDNEKRFGKVVDSFLEVLEQYKSDLDFDAVKWSIYGNVVRKIDKKHSSQITQNEVEENNVWIYQKKIKIPNYK